jgi:hypothetical protein
MKASFDMLQDGFVGKMSSPWQSCSRDSCLYYHCLIILQSPSRFTLAHTCSLLGLACPFSFASVPLCPGLLCESLYIMM